MAGSGTVRRLRTCKCWGQLVIPTGLYSDRSIFRQVVIPTGRYSDRSLFRQVYIPTGRYSDRSLFRQVYRPILTGRYSDRSIFQQVYIPTGRYSDRSIFQRHVVIPSVSSQNFLLILKFHFLNASDAAFFSEYSILRVFFHTKMVKSLF